MISSGENGEYVSSDETWNEGKKDGVSTVGSQMESRCMSETITKESGMARLPDGAKWTENVCPSIFQR